MPRIRKAHAGNDSFGNSWDSDGAVVDVPHEQAEQLLAIDDGEFTLAEHSDHDDDTPRPDVDPESGNAAGAGQTRTGDDAQPTPVNPEFSEVHPAAPTVTPAAVDVPPAATAPEEQDPRVSVADDQHDDRDDSQGGDDKPAGARTAAKKTAARKQTAVKPQE